MNQLPKGSVTGERVAAKGQVLSVRVLYTTHFQYNCCLSMVCLAYIISLGVVEYVRLGVSRLYVWRHEFLPIDTVRFDADYRGSSLRSHTI